MNAVESLAGGSTAPMELPQPQWRIAAESESLAEEKESHAKLWSYGSFGLNFSLVRARACSGRRPWEGEQHASRCARYTGATDGRLATPLRWKGDRPPMIWMARPFGSSATPDATVLSGRGHQAMPAIVRSSSAQPRLHRWFDGLREAKALVGSWHQKRPPMARPKKHAAFIVT